MIDYIPDIIHFIYAMYVTFSCEFYRAVANGPVGPAMIFFLNRRRHRSESPCIYMHPDDSIFMQILSIP